jgi:ubiquitin carboxyl-terminal hydrolase 4/11/15
LLNPEMIRDTDRFDWSRLCRFSEDDSRQEVENRQSVDVHETLRMFSRDEKLDANNRWFCPHCRVHVCANKKMDIWRLPSVLILHFKRFMRTASSPLKLDTKIECPTYLDMAEHVVGPHAARDCAYRLVASIHHSGGLTGGHYVARAYHWPSKRWYLFNDASVTLSSAHFSDPYVVFYVRTEPKKVAKKMVMKITGEMRLRMFVPTIVVPWFRWDQKDAEPKLMSPDEGESP